MLIGVLSFAREVGVPYTITLAREAAHLLLNKAIKEAERGKSSRKTRSQLSLLSTSYPGSLPLPAIPPLRMAGRGIDPWYEVGLLQGNGKKIHDCFTIVIFWRRKLLIIFVCFSFKSHRLLVFTHEMCHPSLNKVFI